MLVLVDLLCALGLVYAAWRTAKAVRDETPSPASTACLQFWILFSIVHFVSQYITLYTRELKVLLIVGCFLPNDAGVAFTGRAYSATAEPLMRTVAKPAGRKLRTLRRFGQATLSALSRNALGGVVPSLVAGASTEELGRMEVSLENCLAALQSERQRRRTMQLAASAPWRSGKGVRGSGAARGGGGGAEGKGADGDAARDEFGATHVASPPGGDGGGSGSSGGARSPTRDEVSTDDDDFDSLLDEPRGGGSWTVVGDAALRRPETAAGGDRALRQRSGRRYKSVGTFMTPQPQVRRAGDGLRKDE